MNRHVGTTELVFCLFRHLISCIKEYIYTYLFGIEFIIEDLILLRLREGMCIAKLQIFDGTLEEFLLLI